MFVSWSFLIVHVQGPAISQSELAAAKSVSLPGGCIASNFDVYIHDYCMNNSDSLCKKS